MRNRILIPLLALVVTTVVLVAVPTLGALARDRTAALSLDRRAAVERIAALSQAAVEHGGGTALRRYLERYHALFGEAVLVVVEGDPDPRDDDPATPLASVGGLDHRDPQIRERVNDFGFTLDDLEISPVLPWSGPTALVSAPVEFEQGLSTGTVVMEVDLTATRADVRRDWLLVLLPILLLLALLVALTSWWSRWILRPVHDLDEATTALAAGEAVAVLDSGPAELRRLAQSFRSMAAALSRTLAAQRELVANTSHQLRNPLAAVRLHVDLLEPKDETDRGTLEAAQRDLDRLDDTVARLLALAEADHRLEATRAAHLADQTGEEHTSAEVLVAHVRHRWASARTRETGVRVEAAAEPGVAVAASEHDLLEMVDTLVENGVKYAGDGSTVQLRIVRCGGGRIELCVDDDGDGLSDEELKQVGDRYWRSTRHAAFPGTGLGLALVDVLARANGGAMQVGRSARGGLEVRLDLPEEVPAP